MRETGRRGDGEMGVGDRRRKAGGGRAGERGASGKSARALGVDESGAWREHGEREGGARRGARGRASPPMLSPFVDRAAMNYLSIRREIRVYAVQRATDRMQISS